MIIPSLSEAISQRAIPRQVRSCADPSDIAAANCSTRHFRPLSLLYIDLQREINVAHTLMNRACRENINIWNASSADLPLWRPGNLTIANVQLSVVLGQPTRNLEQELSLAFPLLPETP